MIPEDTIKRWRLLNTKKSIAQFQFDPSAWYIGAVWKKNFELPKPFYTLHILLCFVPCFPLHITLLKVKKEKFKVKKEK